MQSPLKKLVQKYPAQIKAYKPSASEMKANIEKSNSADSDYKLEGWTFIKKDENKK